MIESKQWILKMNFDNDIDMQENEVHIDSKLELYGMDIA